jgi:hypothetical protein
MAVAADGGRVSLETERGSHGPLTKPRALQSQDLNQSSLIQRAQAMNDDASTWRHPVEHDTWNLAEVSHVAPTHLPPRCALDKVAYNGVKFIRWWFDLVSGYKWGRLTEAKCLTRIVFLETIAGVPGMVAGMLRHTRSLRLMRRDHGWIHTLLEEAENERMHLLSFLEMRKPGLPMRAFVFVSQGIFFNVFLLMYLVSPRFCHRLVGYIEEEAVRTYTHIIEEIDAGNIFVGKQAPPIAVSYWQMPQGASVRDMMVMVRADEAGHKLVNHTFADMHAQGLAEGNNPFLGQRIDPSAPKQ